MIKIISHFNSLSGTLSLEPSNSKRMPLNKGPIFEALSRAQNSMYHLICWNGLLFWSLDQSQTLKPTIWTNNKDFFILNDWSELEPWPTTEISTISQAILVTTYHLHSATLWSWFILLNLFWKHVFNCYRCMEKPVSNWFARSWTSWVQLVLTINSLTLVQALVKLSSRWQHWQIVKWLLELKKQPPLPIMPR